MKSDCSSTYYIQGLKCHSGDVLARFVVVGRGGGTVGASVVCGRKAGKGEISVEELAEIAKTQLVMTFLPGVSKPLVFNAEALAGRVGL